MLFRSGLEGYYENATGSPQPKKPAEKAVEPVRNLFILCCCDFRSEASLRAEGLYYIGILTDMLPQAPGTFGFDHTKYRHPRDNFETIPMDEFGRPERPVTDQSDTQKRPDGLTINPDDPRNANRMPAGPPSPVPFADYAPNSIKVVDPGALEAQQQARQQQQQYQEEEKDAGCCRCVVM